MKQLIDERFDKGCSFLSYEVFEIDCSSYVGRKWHVLTHLDRLCSGLLPELEQKELKTEMMAKKGKQIISNLPTKFQSDNYGKFVAVTFTGKILVICDSLEELYREIAKKNLKENCYIERIGHNVIAQI